MDISSLDIVITLTTGFTLAFILGFIAYKLKLTPLIGYLVAGYIVGPFSPGYVANIQLAEQLSEIGVILLLFGVGLHFSWEDLMRVRKVALPGALMQTTVAAILGCLLMMYFGASIAEGAIVGLAIGVASTVVLVRMLDENNLLKTPQGHLAVGWLIIEDLITVIILFFLPQFAKFVTQGEFSMLELVRAFGETVIKFIGLGLVTYFLAQTIAKRILISTAHTRSYELMTLALLSIIFVVTTGAAWLFGVSLALGAFISGMVIGRTEFVHQAAATTIPMKDAFAALFFIAVGMLFDPSIVVKHPILFVGLLGIILLIKPLSASLLVLANQYPLRSALVVGLALGQIGEFSFILADEAWRLQILRDEYYDLLVACAFASIILNSLFFNLYSKYQVYFAADANNGDEEDENPLAVVVGYGSLGKSAVETLNYAGITCIVIDQEIKHIEEVKEGGGIGILGDASLRPILESAKLGDANWLIITMPDIERTVTICEAARPLNDDLQILAHTRNKDEEEYLQEQGIYTICAESEALKAFQDAILEMVKDDNADSSRQP